MIDSIIKIISEVLEMQANEETSQDNSEGWNSLQHLNIIVALEDVFDISFEPEDIANMKSVKEIEKTIKRYKQLEK